MKNDPLKVRASRLRSAIKEVLGQKISISQSLELVAKEENYDNWDQASALFIPQISLVTPTLDSICTELHFVRRNVPYQQFYAEFLFRGKERNLEELRNLLDTKREHGALIVISGHAQSGKTNTMTTLIKDLHDKNTDCKINLFYVGQAENDFQKNGNITAAKLLEHATKPRFKQLYVVIDQHFDKETVRAAILMVKNGHKVILTKDSSSGKEAIESLIGMLGDEPQKSSAKVDDLLLSLIKNNQVRVIHQKMHEQRICKLTISAEATEIDIKRAVNNVLRMSPDSVVFNVDTKITPQMLNICKHSVKEMESTGFDAEIKFIDDVSITNGATSIGMYSGGS